MLCKFILITNSIIDICLYLQCVCVQAFMHFCVCVRVWASIYACGYRCGGQRLISAIIFNHAPCCFLRQNPSLYLELANPAGLLASKHQGSSLPLPLSNFKHTAFLWWVWGSNSDPPACCFPLFDGYSLFCSLESAVLSHWCGSSDRHTSENNGYVTDTRITHPPPAPATWRGFKISKEPYTRP